MNFRERWSCRQRYLPGVFLAWCLFIAVQYFAYFPFPEQGAANPYPAFALLVWISLVATTTGSAILRRVKLRWQTLAEHTLFSAALGFAVLMYLILALGLAHVLYPAVAYGVLGLLTLLSWQEIRPLWNACAYYLKRPYHPTLADIILGAMMLFFLCYHLLGTLVPPVFFDALVYHLALPKLYVLNHAITYNPYSFFSNFPFNLEMLYTLGLLLNGPVLAKGLNYVIHLLMLAGMYSLARTYLNHRVALLGMTIFYTIPWVGITAFLLYVDIGLGCYFCLSAYAFLNWVVRKQSGWLALCGVLTGVMLGIKYLAAFNALILGFSVLGVLTWTVWQSDAPRTLANLWRAYRPVFWFALPAWIVAAPWYLKSWLWTGNPIYPFVFGGREWDLARLQSYLQKFQTSTGIVHDNPLDFLSLPWHLTFPYANFDISIGPVLLIFLPLLLFVKRIPGIVKYFLVLSLGFLIAWVNGSQQFRFLIPVFPFLAMITGYATTESLMQGRAWLKRLAWGALLIFLLPNSFRTVTYIQHTFTPFDVMMGLESSHDYLSRQLSDLYPISHYANQHLPPEARIMYIGDTRGYYADRPFIANTAHDATPIVELAHQARSAAELQAALTELGVTHIIFNQREGTRLDTQYHYLHWKTEADRAKFWQFYQQHLTRLHTINDSQLLELTR